MKRLPMPNVPGSTPAERLDMAFRKVLTVSKESVLREEAEEKRQRKEQSANKDQGAQPTL